MTEDPPLDLSSFVCSRKCGSEIVLQVSAQENAVGADMELVYENKKGMQNFGGGKLLENGHLE